MMGEDRLPDPVRTLRLFVGSAFRNELIAAQGGGSNGFMPHVWSSLWQVLLAASAGCILGLLLALAASQYLITRSLADRLLEVGRTLPPLIFVPFVAAALGASDWIRFISIAFYSCLTIAVYAMNASVRVQQQYSAMAALLGASRVRRVITVQLPAIVPHLLGPLRLVFSFALGISIVVEYLAAGSGIGRAMKELMAYSRADLIVVGVVWTLLLALLFDALLVFALSAAIRWTDRRRLLNWMSH
jgi:NitT/TauT family transport system permease protein/sulfonate transport system permease protein